MFKHNYEEFRKAYRMITIIIVIIPSSYIHCSSVDLKALHREIDIHRGEVSMTDRLA